MSVSSAVHVRPRDLCRGGPRIHPAFPVPAVERRLDRRRKSARTAPRGRTLRAMARPPQILAMGGGGFSMEAGNALLDDYALSITDAERPRVCFLPTASGDADHY